MNKNIIIALLIVAFSSCNNSTFENSKSRFNTKNIKSFTFNNSKVKNLSVNKTKSTIIADSIFSDKIEFVKLETNSQCLIGHIDKILFSDSLIFIVDSRITKAIYIYNSKGLFINKIARRGKGPEEYIDIQDVDINKWSKEIAVLDGYGTKINFYNYDGKFIKSKSTSPLIIYSLASIDSLNYILDKGRYPENNREKQVENARLLSSNLQDINYSGINIEKGMGNFHRNTQQQFWKFEEGVFFNKPFHDTIYRITNDTIFAEYYIDLNGDNIPYKDKLELTDERIKTLEKKYAYLNGNFIELKDFVYLYFFYPEGGLHTIYSKRSGHLISGVDFIINNPLFNFLSTPITVYKENTLVVLLESGTLMSLNWESCPVKDKYPHLKDKFNSLVNGLTDYDNPILMLYTLKEF